MINTKMLKYGYMPKEALTVLLHTDPSLDIQDIDEVYYPYVRFRYLVTVGKGRLVKKLNRHSDCIIDRVSGSVYISEGNPEFEEIEIDESKALKIVTPMNECYDIGHDFTLKMFIGKAKLMMTPQMQIIEEDEFYKKFYIVTCLDAEGLPYFIMVDAVDGGISVLDHEKYEEEALEEAAKRGILTEETLEAMQEKQEEFRKDIAARAAGADDDGIEDEDSEDGEE